MGLVSGATEPALSANALALRSGDAIPDLEIVHSWAEFGHLAGRLVPEDSRELNTRSHDALSAEYVVVAHAASSYAHQDLTRARHGRRDVRQSEDLRPTMVFDDYRAHV
jgi:hypothetical protein